MGTWFFLAGIVCMAQPPAAPHAGSDLQPLLEAIQAVGPNGAGHREAARAWEALAKVEAAHLPTLLAGLDRANPLAANWIRAAVDAVAERTLQAGGNLPAAALERFVRDTSHAPRARRLAYEWLLRADTSARDRLLGGLLNDPSLELRRDAVARLTDEAAALAAENSNEEAIAVYQRALSAARDPDQVRQLADRLKQLGRTVDLARQFGFVVRWKLIGPFDNRGGKGFDAVYPPENEVDFGASYHGKHGAVKWIDYTCADAYGMVDLNKAIVEEKGVAAYAAAEFYSHDRREVEIRLGSYNALKLWLNGAEIGRFPVYHSGLQMDQYVARGVLQPGRNLILVKVCQNEQTQDWARYWGFQLRVCDALGGAILSTDRDQASQSRAGQGAWLPCVGGGGDVKRAGTRAERSAERLGRVAGALQLWGAVRMVSAASACMFTGSDWLQFRGNDNRSASDATDLPEAFAEKDNVAWKAPLPGPGPSSPIVVEGRVVVTCASGPRQDRLHVVVFDAGSGQRRWERQLWATGSVIHDPFGGVASPTPASDGQRIFAFYSSNDLACFDLEGNLKWLRGLGYESPATRNDVGMASSPLVVGDTVVVLLENPGESFAAGLDTATGETRWRLGLEQDAAWTSPTVLRGKSPQDDLVVLQTRPRVLVLEPRTGRQVALYDHWSDTVASATTWGETILLPADGVRALRCNRAAGRVDLVWHQPRLRAANASVVAGDGRLYVVNSAGVLICADAATGDERWRLRLNDVPDRRLVGPFWATPVLAGGRLYAVNHAGLVQVVQLGEPGKVVGSGRIDPGILASPAVADGAIYLRSNQHLWKIARTGAKPQAPSKN